MRFANSTDVLIFLSFLLFSVIVGVGLTFLDYQYSEYKKRIWRVLAISNHLNFVPNSFLGKSTHVIGSYRGRRLMLDTIAKGRNQRPYTWISLSMGRNPSSPESSKNTLGEQILSEGLAHLHTSTGLSYPLKGQIKIESNCQELCYTQFGIEGNIKYLQFLFDLLSDLSEAYPRIIAIGGEAVPPLIVAAVQRGNLRPLIHQMLEDIGYDTTMRLREQASNLLCPRCLSCYGPHKISLLPPISVTYYGCRTCGQSREFFEGWVIAVLDASIPTEQTCQGNILRVNWLARHTLFDFDEVEIVQATDEEVERFAMNIGNDTDSVRKARYKQICCRVLANCDLSENTVRILQRMFGQVELEELVHQQT